MNKKIYILLGIVQLLLFLCILVAQSIDPRTVGITQGKIISIEDTEMTCFGAEQQYLAVVVPEFYKEQNISIETRYLMHEVALGQKRTFVYWGLKSDIKSPLQSMDHKDEYYTQVSIALFSSSSWITWYFILFQTIKWFLLLNGSLLILFNVKLKSKSIRTS